jgi:hypothetical protein
MKAKLTPKQIKENKTHEAMSIKIIDIMAKQSLSPEKYEQWEQIAHELVKTRELKPV